MQKTSKPYANKQIAVLSNEVCKSSYNLTVSEHRVIKMFLAGIQNYYEVPIDRVAAIPVKTYAEVWDIETSDARKELKAAVVTLWRRELYQESKDGSYGFARWCDSFNFIKEDDTIVIKWSDTILEHISQLKERFTKLDLSAMQNFSSSYSFRLYEILICSVGENSYKNPRYTVDELMTMMQVPPSLRDYRNFKARVLKPCTKELIEKTGKFKKLNFVETRMQGSKKVESLEFQGCGIGNKYKESK
jgi:plasmid replication initiation protein